MNEKISKFFEEVQNFDSDAFMKLTTEHLSEEEVEIFADFIEDFYGVDDDEEVTSLTQVMVLGYLCAKKS